MTVFVELSLDNGRHEIWVRGPGMQPMPAGARLYRGGDWPEEIQFSHETEEAAEADARRLRTYLADVAGKKTSKRELREHAA